MKVPDKTSAELILTSFINLSLNGFYIAFWAGPIIFWTYIFICFYLYYTAGYVSAIFVDMIK